MLVDSERQKETDNGCPVIGNESVDCGMEQREQRLTTTCENRYYY